MSRTFAISDIHGNLEAFKKALETIDLKHSDQLIILGDLIDRGPDSKGVLDTVLELRQEKFDVICLRGNHEDMLLEAFRAPSKTHRWLINGGMECLASFGTGYVANIPSSYIDLIESFKYYHQTDKFIYVHAALDMHIYDPFSDTDTMLWSRDQKRLLNRDWLGNRILIHGHTPTHESTITDSVFDIEPIICIDNGSYFKKEGYGSLCVLQLENFKVRFVK